MALDKDYLRLALAQARRTRQLGEDPFGAVLVRDGCVVHQAHDRCLALCDPTAHAELLLIREYCQSREVFSLEGCTIYSSTEPCAMCAGAIHWACISRIVFSVSQAMLQRLSGGRPKMGCAEIVNSGRRQIEIVGPLLPEEGLAVWEGYRFVPKAERLKAVRSGRWAANPPL